VKAGSFFVVAAAALVVACGGGGSTAAGPAPPPPGVSDAGGGADPQTGEVRYLSLGDSITQGIGTDNFEKAAFPARLTERWRAKGCTVDLKNVGISGYTAGQILADQVPEIAPYKPTFITFQAGANDIANNISIDVYRANVKAVLEAAKKSGARVVVLPQNEWWRSPQGPGYGGTMEKRDAYDAALIEETKAQGAELVDLRALYRSHADQKLWASDGIHPTDACYDEMAAELARVIPSPCGK
jgi:lysophospholipase L1-like esterase